MANVMVVDDDDGFRAAFVETLESLGHRALECAKARDAVRLARAHAVDLVFLDLRLADGDGLEILAEMQDTLAAPPPIVVLTAYASSANTIEAMRLGAFDHLTKPIGRQDAQDVLKRALRPAVAAVVRAEPAHANDEPALIGQSAVMREVHKRIGLAAANDAPVLILGETGTGKELVARTLHRHSARARGPFIAINCAAIPKELLESELFGHVRGAFSGATTDRPGCFRSAHGGVLLLDEIGEMPLDVQAKLLRVLQEAEVTPLGANRPIHVDVRMIAATHRRLADDVAAGRFREDLFYRLDVLRIELPPLRDRLDDIPALAAVFMRRAATSAKDAKSLSPRALDKLRAWAWPGNVRELSNVVTRAVALTRHPVIDADDLPFNEGVADAASDATRSPSSTASLPAQVESLERALIERALAQHAGNRTEAARALGLHRAQLYRKLEQYGLASPRES